MDVMISAFNSVNQSGYFEFIERIAESDHQRKCRIKCNSCGVVFPTWQIDEIRKRNKDKITCPDCGVTSDGTVRLSKRDDIAQYYMDGHSVKETAEQFGITVHQVNDYVKVKKITNGRLFQQSRVDDQKKEAEKKLAQHLSEIGFDYVGGYSGKYSRVKIKCLKCGVEYERTADFLRKGNAICIECQKRETAKRNEEEKRARTEAAELRVKEREERNPLGLSYYQLEKERKLDEVCICKECGKEYTPRQYMESQGLIYYSNPGYCSHECNRKALNRLKKFTPSGKTGHYYERARKYGCEYVPGITLKKLIKRNGLRCAICGEMCDPSDHSWSEYSGPMYPSIDHKIPMAKGGGHTWNNVQVAHIICNSRKGDNYESC